MDLPCDTMVNGHVDTLAFNCRIRKYLLNQIKKYYNQLFMSILAYNKK